MVRRSIRNLNSSRTVPPRLFDVIVENGNINLEVKLKDRYERIPWQDVVRQVEAATESYNRAVNE